VPLLLYDPDFGFATEFTTYFSASFTFLTILPASPLNISFYLTGVVFSSFLLRPDPDLTPPFLGPFPSNSESLASKTVILLSFCMIIFFSLCLVLNSSYSFTSKTLISSDLAFNSSSFFLAASWNVLRCSSSRLTSFKALDNFV
jgi:hypothetical protein